MKLNFKTRSWHAWSGVMLALPILMVALTAVAMSHKKVLGTDDIKLAANWLPGYQGASAMAGRNEPRSSLRSANGETYVGTLGGLYRWSGEQLVVIQEVGDTQIRALAQAPWGRIAAARNGVWLQESGQDSKWRRVLKGDAGSATSQPDGSIIIAVRDKGLLTSTDGQHWQADAGLAAALASLPSAAATPISLSKLLLDLHTGQALFGKEGEWVWIDLVGLALTLLVLTGVYMWWRAQWRKRTASRNVRRMSPFIAS